MTKNLVIRASAGSGKTFRLTLRFLDLLLAGERAERVFATTFTRKAAGEILERVLERLARALLGEEEREILGEQLGRTLPRSDLVRTLTDLTRSLHRLRVDTLDSFFVRLATAYSLDLALPPQWTIADPVRDQDLRRRAVERLLEDGGIERLRTLVTLLSKGEVRRSVSQQIHDVVGGLYPLYLDAAAVDRWRTVAPPAVVEGWLDEHDLVEAKSALDALTPPLKRDGTFVTAWRNALRQHVEAASRDDWLAFTRGGIAAKILAGESEFGRRPILESVVAVFDPLLRHAAALLATTLAQQTAATYELLARYHECYASLAQSAGLFTFDGITRILAGAKTLGQLDDVYYRLDAELHHVLLDEFQDTSLPQWRVLEPLAREAASQPFDHTFFCVGDEKQSIYGWRGGTPEIFGWLERDLPGVETEPMDRSYRSSPDVIATVNRVFGARAAIVRVFGGQEPGIEQWLSEFRDHQTALDLPGYTCLRTAPRVSEGQPVATLVHAADYVEELLVRDPHSTIGILLRRNQAVSRLIHELRSRGIAASDEGGNPLTDSPAVAVILSLLQLADHPGDTVAAFHVATSPLAPAIASERRPDEALDPAHPHRDRALRRVARRIRRDLSERGVAEALAPWIERLQQVSGERDARRLAQLRIVAERFTHAGPLRARDFLDHVAIEKVDDPEAAAVRVMTVHQAKGLEFDRVVLPELDQRIPGQTPTALIARDPEDGSVVEITRFANQAVRSLVAYAAGRSSAPELAARSSFDPLHEEYRSRELRESLSLLYVALTRPRRELHLIIAPSSPSESKLPTTFAGILRAALTEGGPAAEEGSVLFESGRLGGPRVPVALPSGPSIARPRPTPLQLSSDRRVRLSTRPSSSSDRRVAADQLLRPRARVALERGSALHSALERVEWMDASSREQLGAQGLAGHPPLEEWLSRPRFEERLVEAVGAEAAQRSSVEVLNEHPIVWGDADSLTAGVIDRLVIAAVDGRPIYAEIIDYKSDTIASDGEWSNAIDRYTTQLEGYRRAVRSVFAIPRISACLLSLSANRVHRVAEPGETPPPVVEAPGIPEIPEPPKIRETDRDVVAPNPKLSTQLDLFAEGGDGDRSRPSPPERENR